MPNTITIDLDRLWERPEVLDDLITEGWYIECARRQSLFCDAITALDELEDGRAKMADWLASLPERLGDGTETADECELRCVRSMLKRIVSEASRNVNGREGTASISIDLAAECVKLMHTDWEADCE